MTLANSSVPQIDGVDDQSGVYPTPTQTYLPMFEAHLESGVSQILSPLCIPLPPHEIPQLKEQVLQHVQRVHQALARNEFLDVATVEKMADTFSKLLDGYETYSDPHKALIVGAARYFIKADDAEPDTMSLLGFDDDIAVLNYVLDAVGLEELKIEL